MYNAYLYLNNTIDGRRIILAEHVPYAEAEAACRAQVVYLPKLGRMGDTWYSAGLVPRLAIAEVVHEPTEFLWDNPVYFEEFIGGIIEKYREW